MVRELVENLLTQRFRDKTGAEHPLELENILVVAPYNVQVNLLKRCLREGARVGTVDKFQGQEAEVVIVSMTTSSGEYMPRFMDFLYSKNRLNVALSRARSLAIVIANPALLTIPCRKRRRDLCVTVRLQGTDHVLERLDGGAREVGDRGGGEGHVCYAPAARGG